MKSLICFAGETFAAAGLAGLLGGAISAPAQVVTPVAATASSSFDSSHLPANLINGSGLLGSGSILTRTHDANTSAMTMWHSDGSAVASTWLIFDLGTQYTLTGADIWQMNQPCCLGRGIKNFTLYTSPNATDTPADLVGTFQLNKGTGLTTEARQHLTFNASNVRRVMFAIVDGWNGFANDYVGLSEVRFEGSAPAAIATPPQSATNYVWGVHTFSVAAAGTPPLSFQWYRAGSPAVAIVDATNITYVINPVASSSAGGYFVVAANAANSVTSAVATLTVLNPAPDYTNALLAHYAFDETGGSAAADSSGNLVNATLFNFPADDTMWVTGRVGGALLFNALASTVNNQVVTDAALNLQNEDYFSFAFWAMLKSTNNPNNPRLIGPVSAVDGQYWVLWAPSYHGVGFYPPVPSPEPSLDVWRHFVVTYDRLAGKYETFVDGRKQVEAENLGYVKTSPAGRQWAIGCKEILSNFLDPWHGALDDMRIYNRILLPADVMALYDSAAGTPPALAISASSGQVTVSWPPAVTGYALQSCTNLATGGWTAVPGVVNNSISVPPSGAAVFYRLQKN